MKLFTRPKLKSEGDCYDSPQLYSRVLLSIPFVINSHLEVVLHMDTMLWQLPNSKRSAHESG